MMIFGSFWWVLKSNDLQKRYLGDISRLYILTITGKLN